MALGRRMLSRCGMLGIPGPLCFKAASQCTGQASLELQVLLLQPLECWDHRCVSPCLALTRNLLHSLREFQRGAEEHLVRYVNNPVSSGMARLGGGGYLLPSLVAEPMGTDRGRKFYPRLPLDLHNTSLV